MLPKPKRELLAIADRLGWLNWADESIVRLALGQVTTSGGAKVPKKRRNRFTEFLTVAPDDRNRSLSDSVFSDPSCELPISAAHSQPGPQFAEQPSAFLSWVEAELCWLAEQARMGVDDKTLEPYMLDTQLWIEDALQGQRGKALKEHIALLLKLQGAARNLNRCAAFGQHWRFESRNGAFSS